MTNLHKRLAGLLLTLWFIVPMFAPSVHGQSGKSSENKENFISAIRAIGDDESQVEALLIRLDKLSDDDKRDTTLLNELYNLAYRYSIAEKNSAAKRVILRQIDLQKKIGLNKSLIDEWQLTCSIYSKEGLLDSAQWYLQKSEEAWRQSGALTEHPYILHSKAMILEAEGKILEATQLLVRSLAIFQGRGNKLDAAVVQGSLGKIYKTSKVYDKAKHHFRAAYQYFKGKEITIRALVAGVEIASVYRLQDSLDQAMAWNKTNLELARELDNQFMLAMIYMNHGNVLSDVERYEEAGIYLDSSRLLSTQLGLSFGILLYHINKADLLVKMREPTLALREISVAESGMGMISDPNMLASYYDIIYKAHKQLNDFGTALRYYEMSTVLKDSLKSQEALHFMLEGERLIAKERNSREIAELNLAVSKSRFQNLLLLGIFFIVGTFSMLWFSRRIRIEREKSRLAEEEQDRLAADVEMKNRELLTKSALNASMSEMIDDIIRKLKEFTTNVKKESKEAYSLLIRDLELRKPGEEWKEFETRFTQVHEDFHEKLFRLCPDLSPSELKVCSLLRLNLSTKEIAALTNRSKATIVNTRSIIRKKLNLMSDDNLIAFLLTI